MTIELIYNKADNPLFREKYLFSTDNSWCDKLGIRLIWYSIQTKKSTRHRVWHTQNEWNPHADDRFTPTGYFLHQREVPLPDNVKKDAIKRVMESTEVVI